jgi:hypothetical protein
VFFASLRLCGEKTNRKGAKAQGFFAKIYPSESLGSVETIFSIRDSEAKDFRQNEFVL